MPLFDANGVSVDIKCANCGHSTSKNVGSLKSNPRVTCSRCGNVTNVKIDDSAVSRASADIEKTFKNLFKR